jgi:hypothetical protein
MSICKSNKTLPHNSVFSGFWIKTRCLHVNAIILCNSIKINKIMQILYQHQQPFTFLAFKTKITYIKPTEWPQALNITSNPQSNFTHMFVQLSRLQMNSKMQFDPSSAHSAKMQHTRHFFIRIIIIESTFRIP